MFSFCRAGNDRGPQLRVPRGAAAGNPPLTRLSPRGAAGSGGGGSGTAAALAPGHAPAPGDPHLPDPLVRRPPRNRRARNPDREPARGQGRKLARRRSRSRGRSVSTRKLQWWTVKKHTLLFKIILCYFFTAYSVWQPGPRQICSTLSSYQTVPVAASCF